MKFPWINMGPAPALLIVFSALLWFAVQAEAGQGHSLGKASPKVPQVRRGVVFDGARQHGHGFGRHRHPRDYFSRRRYPSVVIIAPYAFFFDPLSPPVATSPFFCVLHNRSFPSRVGLLDHLSGTHRIALNSAAAICPDGAAFCIFPPQQ